MGELVDLEPGGTKPSVLPRSDRTVDRTLALWTAPRRFAGFKRFALRHFAAEADEAAELEAVGPDGLEQIGELLGLDASDLAQLVGIYLGLPFRLQLESKGIDFQLLPRRFCVRHEVVPLRGDGGRARFALGNPFRWALAHAFETHQIGVEEADFVIVTPQEVRRALKPSRRHRQSAGAATRSTAGPLTLDANQPLEPLHRILLLHSLPGSVVS